MPTSNPDRPPQPAPDLRESTGYESADVVAEVLEDVRQREKAQTRKTLPVGGRRGAFALVLTLAATSLYVRATRETGPPPELEAMHSVEEAIAHCRSGIDATVADLGGSEPTSLEAEYLQGGEYAVRGTLSMAEGRSSVTSTVLCEVQFRPESGWAIEHVEVEI